MGVCIRVASKDVEALRFRGVLRRLFDCDKEVSMNNKVIGAEVSRSGLRNTVVCLNDVW
jgi:hypothetical protein